MDWILIILMIISILPVVYLAWELSPWKMFPEDYKKIKK